MALTQKSLFLYGFQVTQANRSIDFRAVAAETPRQATLRLGYYSLNSLLEEVVRAMQAVDPLRVYVATANRNISAGLQNRVMIATNGTFLELLFASGPRTASTTAPLMGFNSTDRTGALSYTGDFSAGIVLVPNLTGYNYLSPDFFQKNFGSVNISASGDKEAIVFQLQEFWQVQFKYIPQVTWKAEWTRMMRWMIQQRFVEFTPDITDPDTFFEGSMEQSTSDGKGLSFKGAEMLPRFPFLYDTGLMVFRIRAGTYSSECDSFVGSAIIGSSVICG